jgi:hypothetical protein
MMKVTIMQSWWHRAPVPTPADEPFEEPFPEPPVPQDEPVPDHHPQRRRFSTTITMRVSRMAQNIFF